MDFAYLHLLINHFPIVGTIIGVFMMAYALLYKAEQLQRAVLTLWVVLALLTPLVMNSGEAAEEKAETAGFPEAIMEEHEEAAEVAFWLMVGTGLLSMATLVLHRMGSKTPSLTLIAFLLSIATFVAMARTGYLGGKIRHGDTVSVPTSASEGERESPSEDGGEREGHH